jgi:very-short-patch-repair endonuclease
MSDLEDTLVWQLKVAGLPAPVREHRFAVSIGRRWRFDLAWPDRKLAVEVEGGTWVAGRHSRGAGMESDMEKYNLAALDGWKVLRVSGHHVNDGRALEWIREALEAVA